jgi:hypothetical protein
MNCVSTSSTNAGSMSRVMNTSFVR